MHVKMLLIMIIIILQTMETRPTIPDRKLLARLVLIREEARNMMGGGILDKRNDRGLNTLPESEVCLLLISNMLNTIYYFLPLLSLSIFVASCCVTAILFLFSSSCSF